MPKCRRSDTFPRIASRDAGSVPEREVTVPDSDHDMPDGAVTGGGVPEEDTEGTPGFPDRRLIDLSRDPTPGAPDHLAPDDAEDRPFIDLPRHPSSGGGHHRAPDDD
jgi:hypothetical protein